MLDVLIVGGGPAGLAAAIAAKQRGMLYLVLVEKAALVNSLLHYPTDMVFFTTPEVMEVGGMPFTSPHEKPTRQEALRYYRRVTDAYQLEISLAEPVTELRPRGDAFMVRSQPAHGPARDHEARAVVIATGAYDVPNLLHVPGEDLPHVSHYHREAHRHYRQRVVIVGGKNSAAEAALEIYRAGAARVLLVHRGPALADSIKYWVKPDIENRIAEGLIAARFNTRVLEITRDDVVLTDGGGTWREPADAVLLLTGYRSDTTLLRQAGAAIDDQGAPVHDAATFETTVPNLFVIGACVAGRQSGKIFIENGRFHGEVVINEIAGRAAR